MSDLMVRGPQYGGTGSPSPFTAGITGAQRVADSHGRFTEAALRGFIFSDGMTTTSISNATFTTGTLGATCTPILGVWNPLNSGKNASILQARLQLIANAVTTFTGPGGLVWATSVNQGALTLGSVPFNRSSLADSGSVCKGLANVALTGLVGNLVVQEASGLISFSNAFSNALTAAGQATPGGGGIDHIDGAIIVPPGGILALLGTTTPSSVSAASSLMWEEILIFA